MDKRYEHTNYEPKTQKKWLEENTYDRKKHPGKLYSIDTPPPTVSGSLHVGHIFSYTQTDIIARYKRMKGFSVFYPFGFDDNGLPTERYVEKKHKVRAFELGRTEFIKLCLQETKLAAKQFEQLWQRMGLSADWNKTYSTISAPVRKTSQESFIRLFEKNYIYRKFEPALYCTTCRTSVAQAELDDLEKPSQFNYIEFKLEDNTPLLIGTTRPELLPSCLAVFYHPDDERYKKFGGRNAIVPIFNLKVPLIADDQVDPKKGTGLVMCCSFGDKTDIFWIKKYTLGYKQSIDHDGRFTQDTGPLAGLKVPPAREKILQELDKLSLLREQKPITHSVNVHERCKKEIEYVALSQWFLNVLEHKNKFLELADQINWYPAFMQSRYKNWVENISWDWCLSRQRLYGIPFPVWHCQECDAVLLPEIKYLPIDPQETPYPGGKCPHCASTNIVPDTDVMDTWNTSSLTPYLCYNLYNTEAVSPFTDEFITEFLPMSMRPQAHDIIRTWAFYTIVKTALHHQGIPWNKVVISGHVLSDGKEKLSKSKEQKKTDPEYLLNQYPADAIRYWTASASLGHDVSFSEPQLKVGIKLLTKLWNAFRFINEHIVDFNPTKEAPQNLTIINEWLLQQASFCFETYENYFNKHEFGLALDAVESFFWHDFCDNYLEFIKDQLFNPNNYPNKQVAATHWTLYSVGLRILQLYAPYVPHVTEAIYEQIYKDKVDISSLHQTKFTEIQQSYYFGESVTTMEKIIKLVNQVRKLKSEHQLSLKTDINSLIIYHIEPKSIEGLQEHEQLIKGITRAQSVEYKQEKLETSKLEKTNDTILLKVAL